jgi:hypothetical protein
MRFLAGCERANYPAPRQADGWPCPQQTPLRAVVKRAVVARYSFNRELGDFGVALTTACVKVAKKGEIEEFMLAMLEITHLVGQHPANGC